ncbi:MAG: hypothetical protein M3R47_18415 [Chloroflexota bacterium]|nr:hypothetical protein [Chloroflexota bacterium]
MEDEYINMDHVHKRRMLIAIAIFLTLLGIAYIYVYDPFLQEARSFPVGIGDFRDRNSYQIDPTTVLTALDSGTTDVFTPVDSSQPGGVPDESVLWLQEDFIKVARALNQTVWSEPLSGWKLYSMHFSTACQDDPRGFAEGDFYYFRTTFRDNGKIRFTTQDFFISLPDGQATWAGGANFSRPLFGWKNIRLGRTQITAEDALTIAEENGGRESRLLVDNNCNTHVMLAGDNVWQVYMYHDDTRALIFRMEIDPSTGQIE